MSGKKQDEKILRESNLTFESVESVRNLRKLFEKSADEETEIVIEEGSEHPLSNFVESARQFGKAGVGLAEFEITCVYLAMKHIVNTYSVESARFWGKIFCLRGTYYIVETEFFEDYEEDEGLESNISKEEDNPTQDDDEEEEPYPKSRWKAPPKVPKEPNQTGVNKKVYFVCQELGKPWIRLPAVTPEQIQVSRQICCLFTGDLDAPVLSCPPFPGTETNYLRAQIARISASTHISPAGYYTFEEEEEEALEEEEGERQTFVKNQEYEPLSIRELADRSVQHWVHHVSYILPQGRVTWWNSKRMLEEEEEEEEQEIEAIYKVSVEPKPERGPPILTSAAMDVSLTGYPPWSARLSSALFPENAVAVVSSNIWPGAHAVAWDKRFDNIYIGWGVKATAPGFQPYLPPNVFTEFQEVPETTEITDPTPEEEAALRKATQSSEEQEEITEEGEDVGEDEEQI